LQILPLQLVSNKVFILADDDSQIDNQQLQKGLHIAFDLVVVVVASSGQSWKNTFIRSMSKVGQVASWGKDEQTT
jgi:hypothetical protein